MLPNFVIIGAQKAGTTSLWRYLGHHPSVFVSQPKETDFFVAELGWRRGRGWYESLFEPAAAAGAEVVGEASPNYAMHPALPGVPERMAGMIPSAKLIYLLRDPIERMTSAYLHGLTRGMETLPIDRALTEHDHYLETSRYAMQIDRYLDHFDRSQLLILLAEDLDARREATLDRALAFLDLPTGWRPPDLEQRFHGTRGKRVPRAWWRLTGELMIRARVPPSLRIPGWVADSPLTTRAIASSDVALAPETKARLQERLAGDIERLRAHLGPDFRGWGLLD